MQDRTWYIFYESKHEPVVLMSYRIDEIAKFLGSKSINSAYSALSHYFSGEHEKLKDSLGNYYTAAKYKESELI